MALPNVFSKEVSESLIDRINKLQPESQPKWGKMNVAQMLAHCAVTYELTFEDKHPKPGFFMKFMLKNFVKKIVTNEVPYKQNSRTAPVFVIADERDFNTEKNRLTQFIRKSQELGDQYFNGKTSHSFGIMNDIEWNNMFYKHLNHHLTQFGV